MEWDSTEGHQLLNTAQGGQRSERAGKERQKHQRQREKLREKPKAAEKDRGQGQLQGGIPARKKKNHRSESDSDEDSPREPRKPFDQECKRLVEKYARARRNHSK